MKPMKTAREELIAHTFAESFFKRFLAVLKTFRFYQKIELKKKWNKHIVIFFDI